MRRPRFSFSIASGLSITGIVGVALAALGGPSYLWANVTFSLALTVLMLAVIAATAGWDSRCAAGPIS
jgi:hypothetical protein